MNLGTVDLKCPSSTSRSWTSRASSESPAAPPTTKFRICRIRRIRCLCWISSVLQSRWVEWRTDESSVELTHHFARWMVFRKRPEQACCLFLSVKRNQAHCAVDESHRLMREDGRAAEQEPAIAIEPWVPRKERFAAREPLQRIRETSALEIHFCPALASRRPPITHSTNGMSPTNCPIVLPNRTIRGVLTSPTSSTSPNVVEPAAFVVRRGGKNSV